jgi:hypothetical protein
LTQENILKALIKQQILINKFHDNMKYGEISAELEVDLIELILEIAGFPKDNTLKYGDLSKADDKMFCSDYYYSYLNETNNKGQFVKSSIEKTYNRLMNELKELKSIRPTLFT